MKARQSYVVVKYNDKDITKTITDYIESFQYVDNASGKADTVKLKRTANDPAYKLEFRRGQPEI